MKRSAAATVALFYTSIGMGAAQGGSAEQAIDRALKATYVPTVLVQRTGRDDPYGTQERKSMEQAARDFEEGLAHAAEQMTSEERELALANEAASIEGKLAAIAVDRRRHPEIYDEIMRSYVDPDWGPIQPRVMQTPVLRPEHVSEAYRLAWEFSLLMPASQAKHRAAEALGAIGNPASAITLLHACKVGARAGVLEALARMPSRAAGDAALEVLAIATEQWPLAADLQELYGDWPSMFFEMVGRLPLAKQSAWLEVARELQKTSPAFDQFSRGLRARLSIQRALEATRVTRPRLEATVQDSRDVEERLDQASRDLDAALAAAAEQMTPSELAAALGRETASIEAKLAAIAADRARRPHAYDEIQRTYVTRIQPLASAPPLEAKHVTEAYRLPWELLILTPGPRDASPGHEIRAAQALGAIGNPASAVTLLHAFDVSTDDKVPLTERVQAAQRLALDALAEMPSRPAAEAIATALRHGESYTDARYPEGKDWNPTAHVVATIAKMPQAKRAAWLAALRLPGEAEDPPAVQPFARALRARAGIDAQ
jgi:hypothetical protein